MGAVECPSLFLHIAFIFAEGISLSFSLMLRKISFSAIFSLSVNCFLYVSNINLKIKLVGSDRATKALSMLIE